MRYPTLLSFITLLSHVNCTPPNIALRGTVDIQNVEFSVDGDTFATVPVTFSRVTSTDSTYTLTAYTSEYLTTSDNDNDQIPTQQYATTFTVSPQETTFSQPIFLNIGPAGNISAPFRDIIVEFSVTASGSVINLASEGAVIAFDRATNQFVARTIADHAYEIDLVVIADMDARGPIDEESPPDGDLGGDPARTDDTILDGAPKDGEAGISTDTSTATMSSTAPPSISTGNASYVFETVDITTTVYVDCPEATPRPICLDRDGHIDRRQQTVQYTFIKSTLVYKDRNKTPQPIQLMKVEAYGTALSADGKSSRTVSTTATLSILGAATFRFKTFQGETMIVDKLYIRLQSPTTRKYYRIGSRRTETDTLVTRRISITLELNPWRANAGQTKSYVNTYPYSSYYKALWVNEGFQRAASFANSKVTRGTELEQIDVWYPGKHPLNWAFFSPGQTSADRYINLPEAWADQPSTIGHEYGHFIHYLSSGKTLQFTGGDHSFCDAISKSATLNFEEGYATAFGLRAFESTPLQGPYGTFVFTPPGVYDWDIEIHNCALQNLKLFEGRVGATLYDLVDLKLDEVATSDGNIGRVSTPGFSRAGMNVLYDTRLVFWTVMQTKPADIENYWYNFQSTIGATRADRAWNVFQYNWAEWLRNGNQ